MTTGFRLCFLTAVLCLAPAIQAATTPITAAPVYRVALVDHFYPPLEALDNHEARRRHRRLHGPLDLDADDLPEPFYHGDLVEMIAAHPQLIFLRYPLAHNGTPMAEILQRLQQIETRFAQHPVDALLLSWESSTLISAFEKPLRRDNVKHYQALIRDWGRQYPVWQQSWQIIRQLERLATLGIKVFTIAGNGGRGMVNTFSFARGVTTVGAQEPELAHFVANNSFVDTQARAAYPLLSLRDANGEMLGYDLDNDQCADIPATQLSAGYQPASHYSREHWQILKGSSFAAPAALKAQLVGNTPVACQHPPAL